MRAFILTLTLLAGCVSDAPQPDPLQRARARPLPDAARARFRGHLDSPLLDLSGAATGGLRVDTPGQATLVLSGPLGGTAARFASDGTGLSATWTRTRRHLLVSDGEALLRDASGGLLCVDAFIGLLLGDLPLDGAPVRRRPDDAAYELLGPDGTTLTVRLDPDQALPRALDVRDAQRSLLVSARYDGWVSLQGSHLPEHVTLDVPALELHLSLRYQTWSVPEDAGQHTLDAPPGFTVRSLPGVLRAALVALRPTGTADPP